LRFERLAYDPRLWSVRVTSSYRAVGVREGGRDHQVLDRISR
jgi:hypothetical protein